MAVWTAEEKAQLYRLRNEGLSFVDCSFWFYSSSEFETRSCSSCGKMWHLMQHKALQRDQMLKRHTAAVSAFEKCPAGYCIKEACIAYREWRTCPMDPDIQTVVTVTVEKFQSIEVQGADMAIWTSEEKDMLKKMLDEGKSFRQCSLFFNQSEMTDRSRNSCIGFASSAGLGSGFSERKSTKVTTHENNGVDQIVLNGEGGVTFMGLEKGKCKWPISDDLFCGHNAHDDSCYCEKHMDEGRPDNFKRFRKNLPKRVSAVKMRELSEN